MMAAMIATYEVILLAAGIWGLVAEPPPQITLSVGTIGVQVYSVALLLFSTTALVCRWQRLVRAEEQSLYVLGWLTLAHAFMQVDITDGISLTALRLLASAFIAWGLGAALNIIDKLRVFELLLAGGCGTDDGTCPFGD